MKHNLIFLEDENLEEIKKDIKFNEELDIDFKNERLLNEVIINEAKKSEEDGENGFDKTARGIIVGLKNLYTDNEKSLVSGIPQLSKLLGRAIALTAVASVPMVGPILAAIGFFTGRIVRKNFNKKEKERLYNVYLDKINYIDEKIDSAKSEKNDKEFNNLIRIRSKLKADAQKLKVLKMKELDRKDEE